MEWRRQNAADRPILYSAIMREDGAAGQARDEFVVLYVSDRDRGQTRSEQDYRRIFPGFEDVISAEWRRLEDHFSSAEKALEGASPVSRERADGPPLFGRYRIERELGCGGQGTVYLALDTHLGRRVALKILKAAWSRSTAAVKRFEREARALAPLDPPGT